MKQVYIYRNTQHNLVYFLCFTDSINRRVKPLNAELSFLKTDCTISKTSFPEIIKARFILHSPYDSCKLPSNTCRQVSNSHGTDIVFWTDSRFAPSQWETPLFCNDVFLAGRKPRISLGINGVYCFWFYRLHTTYFRLYIISLMEAPGATSLPQSNTTNTWP